MNNYRDIGFKLTPQRIAILDYLEGNKQHPSAEEIYQAILEKFPTMSFSTVYNTLTALRKKGKVLELTLEANKKRYDTTTADHGHLICNSCKRIADIPGKYEIDIPVSALQNFRVITSHIEVHGLCPECKERSTP
jgi:Fur family peroxide stress response transcriptional regulator